MGNKRKYLIEHTYFNYEFDNYKYHSCDLYTTKKSLYQMREKEDKYANLCVWFWILFVSSLIFCLIGLLPLDSDLPILFLIIVESICIPLTIMCFICAIIYNNKTAYYAKWREKFHHTQEYKDQLKEFKEKCEREFYLEKCKKSEKLVNIYNALSSNYSDNNKIEIIANLLNYKDLDR